MATSERGRRRRVALVLRGHELELAGEAVDDEVVAGGVESAAHERREKEEEPEHDRRLDAHVRMLVDGVRRRQRPIHAATRPWYVARVRARPIPSVVVLGAGFAGLHAVRRLGRAGVPTLWVDANNYHCFLPLLYQVATAGLEPQEIAYPARSILHRFPTVDFRLAEIVAGDPTAHRLVAAEATRSSTSS